MKEWIIIFIYALFFYLSIYSRVSISARILALKTKTISRFLFLLLIAISIYCLKYTDKNEFFVKGYDSYFDTYSFSLIYFLYLTFFIGFIVLPFSLKNNSYRELTNTLTLSGSQKNINCIKKMKVLFITSLASIICAQIIIEPVICNIIYSITPLDRLFVMSYFKGNIDWLAIVIGMISFITYDIYLRKIDREFDTIDNGI